MWHGRRQCQYRQGAEHAVLTYDFHGSRQPISFSESQRHWDTRTPGAYQRQQATQHLTRPLAPAARSPAQHPGAEGQPVTFTNHDIYYSSKGDGWSPNPPHGHLSGNSLVYARIPAEALRSALTRVE